MLDIAIQLIIWVLIMYGLLSIIRDIININTYKKTKENINFIMTVKNAENGIEDYIRELKYENNLCNSLIIIDLNSKDDTVKILKQLEKEKYNIKVLEKEEGENYLNNMIQES